MLFYLLLLSSFFFFNDTATTEIYTLSLHELFRSLTQSSRKAMPRVSGSVHTQAAVTKANAAASSKPDARSEEHTSELQSHSDLVCRLLLEKKKKKTQKNNIPQKHKDTLRHRTKMP